MLAYSEAQPAMSEGSLGFAQYAGSSTKFGWASRPFVPPHASADARRKAIMSHRFATSFDSVGEHSEKGGGTMTVQPVAVGDSVLAPDRGNLVPGVADEIRDSEVLVRLAEPYVQETGETRSEVWCQLSDVEKLLDDASARPELPPA
jgi:hypothetical protein